MKMNCLMIGISICAVVLLILGSLSNVVGYQSVKSTTVDDSPLFSMRTQKAINQQQNVRTSQYLGMGKGNLLLFPMRDNKTESLIKAIEFISKMDDKTFAQFTELCIQKAKQDTILRDTNPNKMIQALYLLKTNPEKFINSFTNRNNQNITTSDCHSIGNWFPGCISFWILYLIMAVIMILANEIYLYITSMKSCMLSCNESFCFGSLCINIQNKQFSLEENQ